MPSGPTGRRRAECALGRQPVLIDLFHEGVGHGIGHRMPDLDFLGGSGCPGILTTPEELAEQFGVDQPPALTARYNVAPSQLVAVVGKKPDGVRRGLALVKWGLVPDHLVNGAAPATAGDVAPVPGPVTCEQLNERHNRFLGLITSQFLHVDWFHLLGNMLILYMVGCNIEDIWP